MKTHTTKGANILRPVAQLKDMIPGIELHHESLDGRGYPRGLKDPEIPLLPRIIAVADTFDALTTNRPYQQAHDPEAALRIIHNLSGKRLDPTAVAALTAIYERGEIRIQQPNVASCLSWPILRLRQNHRHAVIGAGSAGGRDRRHRGSRRAIRLCTTSTSRPGAVALG